MSKTTITAWEKQFKNSGQFGVLANLKDNDLELRRLKKENKQLKMENDILKQAALIFAKESK